MKFFQLLNFKRIQAETRRPYRPFLNEVDGEMSKIMGTRLFFRKSIKIKISIKFVQVINTLSLIQISYKEKKILKRSNKIP